MSFLLYEQSQSEIHPSTGDEKEVKKIRMHTAKHLELLCLDQEDGFILGSVDFQVNQWYPVTSFTQDG